MANIKFGNKAAFDRYLQMREETKDTIWTDWDEKSFAFSEKNADGSNGVSGGIIFHGKRDNGGDGSAPTFSVCLTPVDGYAIHT